MTKVISIDHGNRNIKTLNHVFSSGYVESSILPSIGGDILQFNNKEYTIVDQCMPQQIDKTIDDRYFILTLFAIGKELANDMRLLRMFASDELVHVELLIGLPLQHFKSLKEKYVHYFTNRDALTFTLNKRSYTVKITSAYVYPQAYAASVAAYSQLRGSKVVNVIDIGGYTVDCLQLTDNRPNMELCTSLYWGVNNLFRTINDHMRAGAGRDIPENIIESILMNDPAILSESSESRINLIRSCADTHASRLLSEVSQKGFDLVENKTVFVGGGSILLKQHILNTRLVMKPIFVDNIRANAEGYNLIYTTSRQARIS